MASGRNPLEVTPTAGVYSWAAFSRVVADELGLNRDISKDDRLLYELALDSLSLVHLQLVVDEMGCRIDMGTLTEKATMGDIYTRYLVARVDKPE